MLTTFVRRLLREEIWKKILPALTAGKDVPFEASLHY